jgi:hypothetical protein
MTNACRAVGMASRRLRLGGAEPLARQLGAREQDFWTKVIALEPSTPAEPEPRPQEERHSSAADLSALVARAARLQTPLLGVVGGRGGLPIATLATLSAGGVCIAREDAALAVLAPARGLPLACGESALLSRLPHGVGAFLALTGGVLGVHELMHVGLAREYVHSSTYRLLKDSLDAIDDLDLVANRPTAAASATVTIGAHAARAAPPSGMELRDLQRSRSSALALHVAIYGQAHEVRAPPALAARLAEISRAFAPVARAPAGGDAVSDAAAKLAASPSEWALRALQAMAAASPVGLELAVRQLRAAAAAPALGDCLRAEGELVGAYLAREGRGADRAAEALEAAEARGYGLEAWHEPFGAFAGLDAPGGAPPPTGSAAALAAQIREGARAAAAEIDGWSKLAK